MIKGWWTRTAPSSLSEIAPGLVETSDWRPCTKKYQLWGAKKREKEKRHKKEYSSRVLGKFSRIMCSSSEQRHLVFSIYVSPRGC